MRFVETRFQGCWLIICDSFLDSRGEFRRVFNADEFAAHGMNPIFKEVGIARNLRKGTFRGMHYQTGPHAQDKLVRVTRGCIADVLIDLRPDSATYLDHAIIWLSDNLASMLYVPKGMAHGYQTLVNDAEVEYHMTGVHVPEAACGIRYNDPLFKIHLPLPVAAVLPRDMSYPDYASND
jgi:dTDP-4-dehydrorhamnose 3,5-epimerase